MQSLAKGAGSEKGEQEVLWEPSKGLQVPGAERAEGAGRGLAGEAGAVCVWLQG